MRSPIRSIWLLGALLVAVFGSTHAARCEEPLTFERAVEIALAANPDLRAARLGRPVAQAEIGVASARPDPEVEAEVARETPHRSLSLAWPIELGGKRRHRIEVAEAEARSGEAELGRLELEIRNRVRRAFYALLLARRRVEETEELRTLAGRIRDAARERFAAGAVARLEVVRAELAEAVAASEAEGARADLVAAGIDLDLLLGRSPTPDSVPHVAGDLSAGAVPDLQASWERAAAASTDLAALEARIAAARARVELARSERLPDPVLRPTVTEGAAPEFDVGWRAALTIGIPLSARRKAEIAAAEGRVNQLDAEREAALASLRGEVASALARAAAQRRRVDADRSTNLPRVAEVAEMAVDSYRSGQTDLVAMLQALQEARDLRLRAAQSAYDLQLALADLEAAMGTPLP